MNNKFLRLQLFLLLFSTTFIYAQKQPEIVLGGGVINAVNDFQVGHETWARVKFEIKNNSSKKRTFKVRFKHSSKPEAVYDYLVEVPAMTSVNHYFPVSMGSSSHMSKKAREQLQKNKKEKRKSKMAESAYILTLLEKKGDRYVPVNNVKKVDCTMDFRDLSSKKALAFFTDDTVEIGNLSKKLGHSEGHFRMTYVHQGTWPDHWSVYSAFDAVVIMRPRYKAFNALAVKALKDYVKMGGSVIFAHHDGIMDAANNEFEELLPIIPLNKRTVNHVPALDRFLGTKVKMDSEAGMEFVEAISKDGSFTSCSWNEFPMIVWKKYGLGMTVAMTISPTQEGFAKNEDEGFRKAWSYLISNTSKPIDMSMSRTDNAREAVNMLNGLTIPGPETILSYLIIYIIATIVIFIALAKMKKAAIAWVVTIVFAFGMTALIFNKAYNSSTTQKPRTAAIFTQKPLVSDAPSVKVYSIFSKNNESLSFSGAMFNDRFRMLPKVKIDYTAMGNTAAVGKPMAPEVIRGLYASESSSLSDLTIQGLSARVFSVLSNSDSIGMAPPQLDLSSSGLTIKADEFPGEISNAKHIYLAGPSGTMVLEMKDGVLIKSARQAFANTLDESLRNVISDLKLSRPVLFFAASDINEDELLNDTYSVNGLSLYVSPVSEKMSGEITIPGEMTEITGSKNSLLIYRDGKWLSNRFLGRGDSGYDLGIKVPFGYEGMKVSEIEIDFKYMNASGNVIVTPAIGKLEATKTPQGTYLFKDIPSGMFKDGKLMMKLITKTKVELTDNLEIFKANLWKVEHLKVSLKGKLEDQKAEF